MPPFLWRFLPYILGVVAVIATGVAAYTWAHHKGYREAEIKYTEQLNKLNAQMQADRVVAEARYKEADARARAQEQQWKVRLEEAQNAHAEAQLVTQKRLARAVTDNRRLSSELGSLRDALAAYAAGAATRDASALTDRERADALGALLGEAVRVADEAVSVATEATAAAESAGDAVRALKRAWPSQ